MKYFFTLFILFFLVSGCTTVQNPSVMINAEPTSGKAPLTVELTGTLENVADNDKRFYCVEMRWEFGDGEHISMIPGCLEWTEDTQIQKEFSTQYTYMKPGTYDVTFTVGDLTSQPMTITVGNECTMDSECFVGGCSGQVCSSQKDVITTCEWGEEYACYKLTDCGCVQGACSWKSNDEFDACINKANLKNVV